MSDMMRWRYGEKNVVVAAVDSATVIEIGDLVWLDTDDAKPASMESGWWGKPDPERFADKFLGVAIQHSSSGDTEGISVATTGVFEMDCPSGTFELGDLLGVDKNAAGTALLNQQVAKVTASKYAIARVVKREPFPVTGVFIGIRSSVITGGILVRSDSFVCSGSISG